MDNNHHAIDSIIAYHTYRPPSIQTPLHPFHALLDGRTNIGVLYGGFCERAERERRREKEEKKEKAAEGRGEEGGGGGGDHAATQAWETGAIRATGENRRTAAVGARTHSAFKRCGVRWCYSNCPIYRRDQAGTVS